MPIKDYGVLKGKASQRILATKNSEHYQILVNHDDGPHRIAINTQSSTPPSQVLFYADDNFHHSLTDMILQAGLQDGFTPLASKPDGLALDFIRMNLFDVSQMVPLDGVLPGDNNDLNDKLDLFVQQAISDDDAVIYAFGQHWLDASGADQYFPEIKPSTGVHDIHMNQGNPKGSFFNDNGVYQDGGLLFHFPSRDRWAAVFTAFQSESFHTDDTTGDPLTNLPPNDPGQPENATPVRIVAAMINPKGKDTGKEYVILLNTGATDIDLTGWKIADKQKNKDTIADQTITTGDTLKVKLTGKDAQLSNKGGIITLLNKEGLKIDGVSYTQKEASKEGMVIQFQ
jgi:uncharacterized protein YukJ